MGNTCREFSVKAKVGQGGRIVIPAEMRAELGMDIGETVVLNLRDGELHIFTFDRAVKRVQERFRGLVPEGVSLVDELLADRRREAALEFPESERG